MHLFPRLHSIIANSHALRAQQNGHTGVLNTCNSALLPCVPCRGSGERAEDPLATGGLSVDQGCIPEAPRPQPCLPKSPTPGAIHSSRLAYSPHCPPGVPTSKRGNHYPNLGVRGTQEALAGDVPIPYNLRGVSRQREVSGVHIGKCKNSSTRYEHYRLSVNSTQGLNKLARSVKIKVKEKTCHTVNKIEAKT